VELLIARRRASAIKESREVDREVAAIGTDRDTVRFNLLSYLFLLLLLLLVPLLRVHFNARDLMLVKSLFNVVPFFPLDIIRA
jgi:hypothetical protein